MIASFPVYAWRKCQEKIHKLSDIALDRDLTYAEILELAVLTEESRRYLAMMTEEEREEAFEAELQSLRELAFPAGGKTTWKHGK